MKEERVRRPRRLVSIFLTLICNRWNQVMYLYHVQFVTMNIRGIDCQKKNLDEKSCVAVSAWQEMRLAV
jgi:hypothetical protein